MIWTIKGRLLYFNKVVRTADCTSPVVGRQMVHGPTGLTKLRSLLLKLYLQGPSSAANSSLMSGKSRCRVTDRI